MVGEQVLGFVRAEPALGVELRRSAEIGVLAVPGGGELLAGVGQPEFGGGGSEVADLFGEARRGCTG